jgi:hypothetical protein
MVRTMIYQSFQTAFSVTLSFSEGSRHLKKFRFAQNDHFVIIKVLKSILSFRHLKFPLPRLGVG